MTFAAHPPPRVPGPALLAVDFATVGAVAIAGRKGAAS